MSDGARVKVPGGGLEIRSFADIGDVEASEWDSLSPPGDLQATHRFVKTCQDSRVEDARYRHLMASLFHFRETKKFLGLFRRREPIPFSDQEFRQALVKLQKARLVAGEDADGSVDAHPLVRAYFGERVLEEQPEAWRGMSGSMGTTSRRRPSVLRRWRR